MDWCGHDPDEPHSCHQITCNNCGNFDLGRGAPDTIETVEELQAVIDDYFSNGAYVNIKDERVFMPTMAGLALHCDVDRKTIINYERKDEFFHAIKKARLMVEVHLEQRLYGNNVTGVIFNLKNNFGWADKIESYNTIEELKPINIGVEDAS